MEIMYLGIKDEKDIKAGLDENYFVVEGNKIPNDLVDTYILEKEVKTERVLGRLMTIVNAKLKNGMVLIETTSCVDEKNYKEEIGEQICLEKIKNKIWFAFGFMLMSAQKQEIK